MRSCGTRKTTKAAQSRKLIGPRIMTADSRQVLEMVVTCDSDGSDVTVH